MSDRGNWEGIDSELMVEPRDPEMFQTLDLSVLNQGSVWESWKPPVVVLEAMKRQGHTYLSDGRRAVIHLSNEGAFFVEYTDTAEVFYLPMERMK